MFEKIFGKFKASEKSFVLNSYANGRIIPVGDIDDEVFSKGMLGAGTAIEPSDGHIYSPCCGKVTHIFETKHAINIISDFGGELLIHIGIDTVKLNGEFFDVKVREGDRVNSGDLLCEFDMDGIKSAGYQIITPLVVCNSDEYKRIETRPPCDISVGNSILRIVK